MLAEVFSFTLLFQETDVFEKSPTQYNFFQTFFFYVSIPLVTSLYQYQNYFDHSINCLNPFSSTDVKHSLVPAFQLCRFTVFL